MLAVAAPAAQGGFEAPVTPGESGAPVAAGTFDWSALIRFLAGWDSNVQLYTDADAPDVPNLAAPFGGITADIGFRYGLTPNLTLGAGVRADLVGYLDLMPTADIPEYGTESDYNFHALQPSLFLSHRSTLADGTDVTLGATYSFRTEAAKTEEGLAERSNQFLATALFDVPGPWQFNLSAVHTFDDFNDIYPLDPLSNRDGQFTDIGVGARYMVAGQHMRSVFGRIAYQRNDAEGINWSYSGFAISGGADFHLHGPFDAKFWASYTDRRYVGDFSSQGYDRRTQTITLLGGQLIWFVQPDMTADLTVRQEFVGGNDPDLTNQDTRITAGLTIRLK